MDISGSTVEIIRGTISNVGKISPITMLFSAMVFSVIILSNRRKLPGSLIALIAAIATAFFTPLAESGVAVISNVPNGSTGHCRASLGSHNYFITFASCARHGDR